LKLCFFVASLQTVLTPRIIREWWMKQLEKFIRNQDGVTAIEYALIASLIAVFIIAAVQAVGTQVSTVFTEVGNSLK
jgi:pilus assembly protein Flp/PilA